MEFMSMAPAPAARAPGNNGGVRVPRAASMAERAMRFWEDLFDKDPEAAEELFFAAMLRDARRARKRRGRRQEGNKDDDEEERRRRARVFQPWEPPPPGSALPLPPPPQPVAPAAAPLDERVVVLGLRAPPHLARKYQKAPPSAPPAAAGPGVPPNHGKKPQ